MTRTAGARKSCSQAYQRGDKFIRRTRTWRLLNKFKKTGTETSTARAPLPSVQNGRREVGFTITSCATMSHTILSGEQENPYLTKTFTWSSPSTATTWRGHSSYSAPTPLQSSPAKHFKGALDAWLAQHTSQAAAACMGLPGSSGDVGGKDGESEDAGDTASSRKMPPK